MSTMAMFGQCDPLTAPQLMEEAVLGDIWCSDTNSMDRDELTRCSEMERDRQREYSHREQSQREISRSAQKTRPPAPRRRTSVRMGKFMGHQRKRGAPLAKSSGRRAQYSPTPSDFMMAHQRSVDFNTTPAPAQPSGLSPPHGSELWEYHRHSASMNNQLNRKVSLIENDEVDHHQDMMPNLSQVPSQLDLSTIKEQRSRTSSAAVDDVNVMLMIGATPNPMEAFGRMEFDESVELYGRDPSHSQKGPRRDGVRVKVHREANAGKFVD